MSEEDSRHLPHGEVTAAVDERHWRVILDELHCTVLTGSFSRGAALVRQVAEVADELGHHPDVDLRYPEVHLRTVSHDVGSLTHRDVALAQRISEIVEAEGLETRTADLHAYEVAVDALDIPAVRPFWKAVLGYVDAEDDPVEGALADPAGRGPRVWFQQMDAPRPQRNRLHVDVSVPHDVAQDRVAAACEAGGAVLSDARAPAFWVLADPEGNEVCVSTWQARPSA